MMRSLLKGASQALFALAGLLFLVGGRAISEYTKTDRLSADGLGIGLAVVCAVIGMLAKDAADNLDDEGSAPQ
jgi:drug/metabolite transporter (DMT)-like permease